MIVDTDQYVAIAGLNPTAIQASASALRSRDLKEAAAECPYAPGHAGLKTAQPVSSTSAAAQTAQSKARP